MTRDASVVRDAAGLQELAGVLQAPVGTLRSRADFEDAALTATARVVARRGGARTETRGCHHRSDHPDADPAQAFSRTVHAEPAACLR